MSMLLQLVFSKCNNLSYSNVTIFIIKLYTFLPFYIFFIKFLETNMEEMTTVVSIF